MYLLGRALGKGRSLGIVGKGKKGWFGDLGYLRRYAFFFGDVINVEYVYVYNMPSGYVGRHLRSKFCISRGPMPGLEEKELQGVRRYTVLAPNVACNLNIKGAILLDDRRFVDT